MSYQSDIQEVSNLIKSYDGTWDGISAENVARMRAQNRFRTGLDIARHTAKIMREDLVTDTATPAQQTPGTGPPPPLHRPASFGTPRCGRAGPTFRRFTSASTSTA